MEEIEPIIPIRTNISQDDKIFVDHLDDGTPIGEPYSINDCLKLLENISGVNEELLGKNALDKQ